MATKHTPRFYCSQIDEHLVPVAMEKQKVVFSVVICLCSVFTSCVGESILASKTSAHQGGVDTARTMFMDGNRSNNSYMTTPQI